MSPRTAEANDILHGERRDAILNAALDAFVENGFAGTRMQEIAERCSLSYGLVYHYFATKEAIFAALVDMALAAAGSLLQAFPQSSPPLAVDAFVAYAVSDPSPKYFALIVEALSKKGIPSDVATRARETVLGLKAAIAAGRSGLIPGDGDAWAEGILAILLGASMMKVCGLSDGSFAGRAVATLASSGRA